MTPVFACFPVCLTFVSLALVGLIVVAAGVVRPSADPPPAPGAPVPGTGPPPWWVVVLIFVGVLVHFALLVWLWPEL
ncbi:MAG: hypothetical protein C0501_25330 [Isosphaera sp.]|nr:hypothetical protein [Isosphaera sp.]